MTAGADTFSSGLFRFTRFDLLFLVAEPTRKGVRVYRQYTDYTADFDVAIKMVGNKVHGEEDLAYLREQVGGDLLTWFGYSPAVRAMEQGRDLDFQALNTAVLEPLALMQQAVDIQPKGWEKFSRQGAEFHIKNAKSWANVAAGADLSHQVDPDFVMGPGALVSVY